MDDRTDKLLRLTREDCNAGATVLGRTFTGYELLRYHFYDERERCAVADALGFIALSICLRYGEA